jgi:hypothetical protein
MGLTREAALRTRDRLRRHYGPLFAPHPVSALRNPHRSRGAWTVAVVAPSWARAVRLCERLRARGGFCAVVEG